MVINTIRELMQGIEWVEIATFMSIVLCDLLSKVSFAFVNKYSSKILFLCLQYLARFREFKDYNFVFKNSKTDTI